MNIDEIRKTILIALYSEDELVHELVLKGGNALALIHKINQRASVDLDFSISAYFSDPAGAAEKIFRSLRREFARHQITVFDERFEERPAKPHADQPDWWGGYVVEFKLIDSSLFQKFDGEPEQIRRNALVIGPQQKRTYKIDISKHEYCEGKQAIELDYHTIYVYSFEMIAVEKMRAICQQMDGYEHKGGCPRARDFYDICLLLDNGLNLSRPGHADLFFAVFGAKEVPLSLLRKIGGEREFHRLDWPSVEASVDGPVEDFDHYFDRVVQLVENLDPFWEE